MNIKVVEYTYPLILLSVIYLICDSRDLRHTNNLQDVALHELTKSLPLLVKTNIDSYHHNQNSNKIETESEILKKDPHQGTMKEDNKNVKSMSMNDSVSRKAFHSNYDKYRYGHDVPMIPTNEYTRQSFDAAKRIENNKKTNKEIWTKQKSFQNKSRKAMNSQKPAGHDSLLILRQKQKKQLNRNMERRKLTDEILNKTTIAKQFNVDTSSSDIIPNNGHNLYDTSCVLTKAEVFCDDDYSFCSDFVFRCTDTSDFPYDNYYDYDTWQEFMLQKCPKTCDACPTVSLLENQINIKEDGITTFNVSLNVNTDSYANETSWTFLAQGRNDSIIFNSSESNATSKLENNAKYKFNYYCTVHPIEENQLNDETKSICYHLEVHDSYGNGMCCEYGDGLFSMNINTNSSALKIKDEFQDGSVISTSFCIGHDDGEIRSNGRFITTKQPSHYPLRWQCKNGVCICDSKPSLTNNIHENHVFLLEVSMLSYSDKLQDVESAQYKAACWVLYDDPYEHHNLAIDRAHNRRKIQRYILAVFYFTTSPEKWEEHFDFLSSRSECDWNYDRNGWTYGISCDKDDNVTEISMNSNNLDGAIVEELSGLRILEYLDLRLNNIRGTIPSVLGRLSQLRDLNLGENDLEGTIPFLLGRLSQLRSLNLVENDLEKTIPPQLFNATNLEELHLDRNRLEGTIPETIGNLQKLSRLDLGGNNLSGSIPDALYMLKNLVILDLNDNRLSSSISTLIGNLNKLELLWLINNMLTGQIPSTIGSLSSLEGLYLDNNMLTDQIPSTIGSLSSLKWLSLYNNTLSGSIPESLFDVPYLSILLLQNNSVTGSVPNEFCERSDDYNYFFIKADCRNDVFDPEVRCNCCLCKDESPIWDGDCADTTINVVIDHNTNRDSFVGDSWYLEWSLTNDATGKKMLHDGPYRFEKGLDSYKACVAYSDCISFNQISTPSRDTNYTIYWKNNSIQSGTFLGFQDNDDINKDDPLQTLLSFQYNKENQRLASCGGIEFICGEKEHPINLKPNTTKRIIYDQTIKISGKTVIHDTSSPQSKALCWILNNNPYVSKTDISDTEIIQRYVLAILHVMSPDGLFRNHEYPPNIHECDWNGITCKDNDTKIVTGISLSNQIINGTLIDEVGSLKYLKVLNLNHTQLHGNIPRSFSNLWSLTKLDLSDNRISGTMPATLYRQLNKLEYINLSNNKLSGSINDDIGSHYPIRFLSLGKNLFTGSLPLDKFRYRDLEHLDISENELSGLDLSLLLKNNNLKTLDVSRNFLVGSLLEHTFTSLSQLDYFNISQNDFSGTIPTTFPELSNITHLDIHDNRFKGPIPLGITELYGIQHLNLQGNMLTGSLPSQLNRFKSLNELILSHNELKGFIPFEPTTLQNMQKLHLHSNKLSGKAPEFHNLKSYITDCGFPSDSLEPVSCSTCNTCCNSDGVCQSKTSEKISQVQLTVIFVVTIVVLISMCYVMKDFITSNKYLKSFFSETVFFWNAMMLISDRSVYHFLLAKNKTEWFIAVCCVVFQTATLFLFVQSADMSNRISDREYTMICPANSLDCENSRTVSSYGLFVFALILTIWIMKDIVGSIKLMLVSFQKRSIDFFFASAVIFTVTMLSIWTSVIYIIAIAIKNTDMIKDAVVLLFVVEIDERIFQLVESINPDWIKAIDNNMRQSLIYGGDDLVITSWLTKFIKLMESMRQKIRERYESFRMRNSRRSGERKVNEDNEKVEELHGENDVAVGDSSL